MRIIHILLALVICSTFVVASLPEEIKECVQRGYATESGYCIFPDDSRCLYEEFNQGLCGQEFMIEDYCIGEGVLVWDQDKCCEGLMPYLSVRFGQPKCEQITLSKQIDSFVKHYMIIEIILSVLLIGIFVAIIMLISWVIKKIKNAGL